MIKKIIALLSVAAVVISGIVFYWPQSFAKLFEQDVKMYIQHIENVYDENGEPKFYNRTTEFNIEPGSEQYIQLVDTLSHYKYHRSLRALFEDSSVSWVGNEAIQIFIYQGSDYWGSLHNVGSKEILFGSKKYHLGYWGDKKAKAMLRDIKAVLTGAEEA